MRLHRFLVVLIALAALLFTVGPAGAQEIDLGNDGIDLDCEDFPERNAAEGYFAYDGGSADRNVDGLDTNGDGIPCNEADYDGEQPEYVPPVVGDEPQTDPEPVNGGDGSYVPPVVGDEPQTDPEPATVTSLPTTGSGHTADETETGASVATLLGATAALMAGAGFTFRRAQR